MNYLKKLTKRRYHFEMKTKEEILFEHYDKDPDGWLLIDDKSILAAMEEYANERMLNFVRWHYKNVVGRFECERLIKRFNEEEAF